MKTTPLQYLALCNTSECRWCGGKISNILDAYPHSDGWEIAGYEGKQWLSRKCTKCGYDWSLNKLGVPRG